MPDYMVLQRTDDKKNLFDKLFGDFDKYLKDKIIKRAIKGKKLSKHQTTVNKKNSKVRVEHVFGYCEQSERVMFNRVIGFVQNAAQITMMNLVYNLNRYDLIVRFISIR
jgi:hypothetical protein